MKGLNRQKFLVVDSLTVNGTGIAPDWTNPYRRGFYLETKRF